MNEKINITQWSQKPSGRKTYEKKKKAIHPRPNIETDIADLCQALYRQAFRAQIRRLSDQQRHARNIRDVHKYSQ